MAKILVIGHSHTIALKDNPSRDTGKDDAHEYDFLLLRKPEWRAPPPQAGLSDKAHKRLTSSVDGIDRDAVRAHIERSAPDAVWLCINGNEHSGLGLFRNDSIDEATKLRHLKSAILGRLDQWLDFLLPLIEPRPVLFFAAPPPVSSLALEDDFPPERVARYEGMALEDPAFRVRAWREQCRIVGEVCAARGLRFVMPPDEVFDADGLLQHRFWSGDPMHGNAAYGRLMREHLRRIGASQEASPAPTAPRARHPYADLPDSAFWKQSISQVAPGEVDPVVSPPFRIGRKDKVATAGSCFAQHISKRLRGAGFRYTVFEHAPADAADGEVRGFYDFSARYGNVYTARQLRQLFDRAFGFYRPVDRVWTRSDGRFCDPFRPRIEPDGFESSEAVEADARRHLAAVRKMFQRLDVFVFTLGLTECWISRLDDAAYPVAPGVAGGTFDPQRHAFVNFSVADVVADLEAFVAKLAIVNPGARIVLTVSPVPLVATAAGRHVLVSTVHSKSVLRVAAEEIAQRHRHVCYFPSYEIITGPHAAGGYFEADRRSVSAAGVDHVMRVFMGRMTEDASGPKSTRTAAGTEALDQLDALANAACDEEMLAR